MCSVPHTSKASRSCYLPVPCPYPSSGGKLPWPSRITAVQDVASGLTLVSAFPSHHAASRGSVPSPTCRERWRVKGGTGGGRSREGERKVRSRQECWRLEGNDFWEHMARPVYCGKLGSSSQLVRLDLTNCGWFYFLRASKVGHYPRLHSVDFGELWGTQTEVARGHWPSLSTLSREEQSHLPSL